HHLTTDRIFVKEEGSSAQYANINSCIWTIDPEQMNKADAKIQKLIDSGDRNISADVFQRIKEMDDMKGTGNIRLEGNNMPYVVKRNTKPRIPPTSESSNIKRPTILRGKK
ncbi:hypothetical protein PFISCL1PPCAC_20967, partial [Pristionchus fissidentatus]